MKTVQPFSTQIICSRRDMLRRAAGTPRWHVLVETCSCGMFCLLLLILISTTSYAQTDSNENRNSKSSDISPSNQQSQVREPIIPKYEEREISQVRGITFWNILRWIVSLLIVIGLIYVVMYLLKKGWIQRQRPSGNQGSFNILGHMPIGPKRMLYLVEVANRVLVLGVTESGISTLSEITDKETVQSLKKEALMYETDSRFVQYLKKAASKAKPAKS